MSEYKASEGEREEVVRQLPVQRLSYTSLSLYMKCPLKWKYRYIDGRYEPRGQALILGSAVGNALTGNFKQKIESQEDMEEDALLDLYSDTWTDAVAERDDTLWDDLPGVVKDRGINVVKQYRKTLAVNTQPRHVERMLEMHWPGAEWEYVGRLDVEDTSDRILDIKVKAKMFSETEVRADLQPDSYLALRRAADEPANGFKFHVGQYLKNGARVTEVPATRSGMRLDIFEGRILQVAREIAWRAENDEWAGALPGSWYCSNRYCGFFKSCPYGGRY